MQLVIGILSTWSLRAWMCSKLASIECDIHAINLEKEGYKAEVLKYSPTGLVPVLKTNDLIIHDSLAIVEYFNECSNGALYPSKQSDRALARSLCLEMHSGFITLRSQCPFTFNKVPLLANLNEDLQKEIDRIEIIFAQANRPFMFNQAGAVDAVYAILAFRLKTYGIVFNGHAGEYQQNLLKWPLFKDAVTFSHSWESENVDSLKKL